VLLSEYKISLPSFILSNQNILLMYRDIRVYSAQNKMAGWFVEVGFGVFQFFVLKMFCFVLVSFCFIFIQLLHQIVSLSEFRVSKPKYKK